MSALPKCTRWRGHSYEARFDTIPPSGVVKEFEGNALAYKMMIGAHTKRIYVHDICTRCGHIVKRDRP